MKDPEISGKSPKRMMMEKGEYYCCSCGKNEKQPYCDG